MIDQNKLLECMEEIKEIAMSQQGRLTREEIGSYLKGMELDGQQMEAVYQYLGASGITVEGFTYIPEMVKGQAETKTKEKTTRRGRQETKATKTEGKSRKNVPTKSQRNLQLYQRELSGLEELTEEQEKELLCRFWAGEKELRNQFLQSQLKHVVAIANKYQSRGIPLDEIIAEGNIGLMNGMALLEREPECFRDDQGQPKLELIHSAIEQEVRRAMESMIDEMTEKKDWENTLLARTNLLHEAAKYLAEELGRVATWEELSEYTRIPIEEIHDIMGISEEVRKAF